MFYPFVNLFREGGGILFPIFGVAVLVFHIAFGKLLQVHRLRRYLVTLPDMIKKNSGLTTSGFSGNSAIDAFVNRIRKKVPSADDAEKYFSLLIRDLRVSTQSGLSIIATGIVAAPLLGLLGTIIGMHEMFTVISEFGFGSPAVMADAISTALQATLTGLAVAVAAIFLLDRIKSRHHILLAGLQRIKNEMITTSSPGERSPQLQGEPMLSRVNHNDSGQQNPEINLAPFVDTIMILLIFFVVTANLYIETGVTVTRPKAKSATSAGPKAILVGITRDGTIHLYGRQTTLERLGVILEQEAARQPDASVVIVADRDGVVGRTVEVIDKCSMSGIQKVSIAANKELD